MVIREFAVSGLQSVQFASLSPVSIPTLGTGPTVLGLRGPVCSHIWRIQRNTQTYTVQ